MQKHSSFIFLFVLIDSNSANINMDKFPMQSVLLDSNSYASSFRYRPSETLPGEAVPLRECGVCSIEYECSPFCFKAFGTSHAQKPFASYPINQLSDSIYFLQVMKGAIPQTVNSSDSLARWHRKTELCEWTILLLGVVVMNHHFSSILLLSSHFGWLPFLKEDIMKKTL
jgi:hypothetical protein